MPPAERQVYRPNPPVTLVMTATVSPPAGMPDVARNDPETRLFEYKRALKFYLSASDRIQQVVILENSGFNLTEFHDLRDEVNVRKSFRALNTLPSYDFSRGKGYGEFMMIDEGIKWLLREGFVQDRSIIWKVTGRLIVNNINQLIGSMPTRSELYCDLRSVPLIGGSLGGNYWMDLRVFAISVREYMETLAGKYRLGSVLEQEFFPIILARIKESQTTITPRFMIQPHIIGVSGFSNKSYTGFSYRAKSTLRAVTRTFLPGLWL
jgi:hypothetical protein